MKFEDHIQKAQCNLEALKQSKIHKEFELKKLNSEIESQELFLSLLLAKGENMLFRVKYTINDTEGVVSVYDCENEEDAVIKAKRFMRREFFHERIRTEHYEISRDTQ